MKKNYSIYAVTAALLLTGCTQDIFQNGDDAAGDSRSISFTASQTAMIEETADDDMTRSTAAPDALPLTGDGMHLWLMPSETPMVSEATRGTQINSVEELNNFGVSAYRHGAIPAEKTLNEYLTDNNLKPDFFYNLEATKITDTQKFKLTKDFFWPTDDDVLSFFAYAPYGDENVELSAATADGPQSINFKVDTDVKKQVDLITAQASTKSHLNTSVAPSVALNFTHQLTGIRFVIGDQFLKGWIKSISLKGVYTQGTYTIGDGWTLDDTKKGNFTISYNLDKPVAGTPGEEVSASDEVFMMIPHTFAADDEAIIEVVYNDKYTDYIVSAPLKGQTWKAGKTVTYAITSNKLTTLRIGQIQFATTPEGAPKRIWQAGDKIGMYVVEADGKKLKHKNVPVTYDGANWNIDHTTAEGTIYKLPGESFYFYYPYSNVSNGQPTGYPEQCPELKAEAPVFFEGVIDYSTIKTDQSSLDNFLSSDLQVGRAEDDGRASMIKATMLRQRGVAVLALGAKSAKKKVTFLNGSTTGTVNETANVTATSVFASGGNKPYQNGTKYYYYTKPNVSTSFNSATTEKDAWHEALVFNLEAGATTTLTAYSDRAWWDYINAVWNYEYTNNNNYTFTAKYAGNYTMECWGAQGGDPKTDKNTPGKGGYTKGTISLSSNQTLYVYIGGEGGASNRTQGSNPGGYNGGGYSGGSGGGGIIASTGGGGATDIRAIKGTTWQTLSSLRSRIMVAAGGGGSGTAPASSYLLYGGFGGGLIGGTGGTTSSDYGKNSNANTGGGQTSTGNNIDRPANNYPAEYGAFGYANQTALVSNASDGYGGGGGGGWYGGLKGFGRGGSGGSSFISGHTGCNAINPSTGAHLGASTTMTINNVNYKFTSTQMIAGNATQAKPGGGTETGHSGNGYARITLTRF